MINVCVPVLRRYDLLRELLISLRASTVQPDKVWIVHNGRDVKALQRSFEVTDVPVHVHASFRPLSVAESWNWFITTVPEERVIVNDDVLFAPESLELLVASKADLVWATGCGFSCFLIRDRCVEKLGLFDEAISPGYAYYEDQDYLQRLDGCGTRERSATAENVKCGAVHLNSQTLQASSPEEIVEHHRRFKVAQQNYIKKWHLEETFK